MSDEQPLHDPLRAFLDGRRRWPRVPMADLVEVRGGPQTFIGQVLDLSRGGAQILLMDPAFYAPGGDLFSLVARQLHEPASVTFVERKVHCGIHIVRILPRENGWVAVGCAFDRDLTPAEAERLGVAGESSTDGADPCTTASAEEADAG